MEEPTAFYSVNRPELERILIPSQWLDLGFMFYGQVLNNLEYNIGMVKGLNAGDFRESSWVRQGRFMALEFPENVAAFGKLKYSPHEKFEIAAAGYHGNSGYDNIKADGSRLLAPLTMTSLYFNYEHQNFSFFGVGMMGWLGDTDHIYHLTSRVIGEQTMGYYGEVRCDLMHYVKPDAKSKLPVFFRLEQLRTHASVHANLMDIEREELDLFNITCGINYRPKRNIALKANYQFRNNRSRFTEMREPNLLEFGIGLIY
ncbi:MAG: hypothetical protein JJT94_08475 [Bernardetiaceae bacterium]|nr:hypothetical protein [Bernardetiaceae bacterium]